MIKVTSKHEGEDLNVCVESRGTTIELIHEFAGLLETCHNDEELRAIFCAAYELYEEKTNA